MDGPDPHDPGGRIAPVNALVAIAVAPAAATLLARVVTTTRLNVVRRDRRVREDPPYVGHRTVTTQHLMRETLVAGRVVRRVEIDREEVDQNDLIELGCLGSCSWRSRFAGVIAERKAERLGA